MKPLNFYSLAALVLSLATFAASTSSWGQTYDPLLMGGDVYQSACSLTESEKLQGMLKGNKVQDSSELWRALDAILCAPKDEVSRAYVRALIPEKVRKSIETAGGKTSFELVPRTDDLIQKLMAEGKAWSAAIRIEDQNEVVLQYFINEACVRETTFRQVGSKWSVYEFSTACD